MGFTDATLAKLSGTREGEVADKPSQAGIHRVYRKVDTCAGEFSATTPYFYSRFGELDGRGPAANASAVILGSGPVRIGQGIEFDACCVHAVAGLRAEGLSAVMVNCNPETVSTDWDSSDRLFFEPLHSEDVLEVCRAEKPRGVLIQFGGQTPLKLAKKLQVAGVPILGTQPDAVETAENRALFAQLMRRLGLRQPEGETEVTLAEAHRAAAQLGYPVLVRPSYVLGGRGMQVVYSAHQLAEYWHREVQVDPEHPVLLDRFLERAVELDVDLVADGKQVVICGVLEHVDEAGVHSGDSSCVLGAPSLPLELLAEVRRVARLLAAELNVIGLCNLQLAVKGDEVWVLEANPRASRTVPFVSKATGVPWATVAARVCCGAKLRDLGVWEGRAVGVAVKMPVFPFDRFPGIDPVLGPEMRSTGEVMGLGRTFGVAFAKAALAARLHLPAKGNLSLFLADADKRRAKA
ncbi:MAG: carbamoyl-phosphate synthase large subunit [Thermoanaerobaculum sp.]|nr:carbamoyl-phosphate synthase large subunit [Thermoanaerobaculum sp.]MDW7967522.1 carbamoyl-phosphate synthase large subunit [Thermoanaerobaculum sp.]